MSWLGTDTKMLCNYERQFIFVPNLMSTCDFFVFLLSRGPKPDFSHPFFLFGIPVVAVFYGIVTYYSTFKEITWKDFVNLYLYRGVVSFCTYKTCIQESGLVVPWLVFTHIQESGLVVPWLVFTHVYTGKWSNCPMVSFYTYLYRRVA